jgi:hypothetical protein
MGPEAAWERWAGGLESLRASLSLPRRLVRVFRPVVRRAMLSTLHTEQALACGGAVASQLIGDEDSWNVREIFEPRAQECFAAALSRRRYTRRSMTMFM